MCNFIYIIRNIFKNNINNIGSFIVDKSHKIDLILKRLFIKNIMIIERI